MADHNELGWKGEDAAVKFLASKGHRIIERNWTFGGYEVDIVTEHEAFIVFVEVKTRTSDEWGNPEDFVTKQRMRRMIAAANHYLILHGIDKPTRFDIVSILWNEAHYKLEHIEDAFMAFM
jgi:putative endonuclease